MNLDELSNEDLSLLHSRVRESIELGYPLGAEVKRYGIRDLTSLRQWIAHMESLLDAQGITYRPID